MACPRRFNHEEALVRVALGERYADLAAEYGVSKSAVAQAVKRQSNPEAYARYIERHRLYQQQTKKTASCKRCGKTIWSDRYRTGRRAEARTGLCTQCRGLTQATSVRPTALRCGECGEWKPDAEFGRQRGRIARRGRHSVCKACSAEVRRRSRHARRVPCALCGKPRSHPNDRGGTSRNLTDSGLCQTCFRTTVAWRKT